MKRVKQSFSTRMLMLALFLGVLAYFGVQAVRYIDDPLTTTLAYPYQVETGLELSGWVVRQERVLEDESGGLLRVERGEGERVGVGGTIAAVYSDQASLERQTEIDTLNSRIEQLQYAQSLALEAETTRKLDSQISQSILRYRSHLVADRLYDANEEASQLRALVTKRDYSDAGGMDINAQLQALQQQAQALQSQAAYSVRRITAPVAGLYSGIVDGYEAALTPEAVKEMTPAQLGAVTPADSGAARVGKLITGREWYYAAVMDVDDAEFIQRQHSLSLRFSKGVDQDLPVTLDSLGPQENGRVVALFRSSAYLQEVTLLRQQRAQVLYSVSEGIRVPKEAVRAERAYLTEENGLVSESGTGVYCVVGLMARFKPVEIIYSGDGSVLVRSTAESNTLRLRSGEEVIVSARGLFDGKILQ